MTHSSAAHLALANLPEPPSIIDEFGSPGSPIVFLLDENHDVAAVVADNVRTARTLVENSLVELIGIENIPAEVDEIPKTRPPSQFLNPLPPPWHSPGVFEAAMQRYKELVVGIDSPRLIERIFEDELNRNPADASQHSGQEERSRHFVRAMMRESSARKVSGNCLISCGSDHNTHILAIARDPNRPDWWPDWTFIRIRAAAHP